MEGNDRGKPSFPMMRKLILNRINIWVDVAYKNGSGMAAVVVYSAYSYIMSLAVKSFKAKSYSKQK